MLILLEEKGLVIMACMNDRTLALFSYQDTRGEGGMNLAWGGGAARRL